MTAAIRKLNEKAQARETAAKAAAKSPAALAPAAVPTARIPFIHLKVHSAYSLLEGALPIGKLAKLADKLGYPAVGLTDTNNMFGVLEFSDKMAGAGIQPIVGMTLDVDFLDGKQPDGLPRGMRNEPVSKPAGPVALIAMNDTGYANLMVLSSKSYLETGDAEPTHIKIDALEAAGGGLIALTGGPDGPIDRALRDGQRDLAVARLKTLSKIFGDALYVEIQRHGLVVRIAGRTAIARTRL